MAFYLKRLKVNELNVGLLYPKVVAERYINPFLRCLDNYYDFLTHNGSIRGAVDSPLSSKDIDLNTNDGDWEEWFDENLIERGMWLWRQFFSVVDEIK